MNVYFDYQTQGRVGGARPGKSFKLTLTVSQDAL